MDGLAALILPPTYPLISVGGMTTLGRRIKQLRKARGLTRPDLAEAAGVKTTPGAVYQWETGRTKPSTDKLAAIAKALSVSVGELVSDEDAPVTNVTRPALIPDSEDSAVRNIIQQALHLTPTKRRAVVDFLIKAAEVMDEIRNEEEPPTGGRS